MTSTSSQLLDIERRALIWLAGYADAATVRPGAALSQACECLKAAGMIDHQDFPTEDGWLVLEELGYERRTLADQHLFPNGRIEE